MTALDWSGWDWGASVARYRREIAFLLSGLLASLGMAGGAVPRTVSRRRRLAVLSVLRPLEAALRRVIVMAMRQEGPVAPSVRRSPPDGSIPRGGKNRVMHVPALPLFDPRKSPLPRRRHVAAVRVPRISFFDGFDPPRPTVPSPGDVLDAGALARRLLSAKAALADIPRQARRMARAIARREAAAARPSRPVRPARPPGHRHRGRRPVDFLLAETHQLACIALQGGMRAAGSA